MISIEHFISHLLMLVGFIGFTGLFIVESRGDNDVGYVFEAEKPKPINFRCDHKRQMDKYRSLLAYNVTLCKTGQVKRIRCVKSTVTDGNCLFRAISYGLFNNENHFDNVRQNIVEYVVHNWDFFKPFVSGYEDYGVRIRSINDYKRYMGRNRTWGTNMEIVGAAHVYRTCFQVYTDKTYFHKIGEEYDRTVALYYSYLENHYYVVEDVFRSCQAKRNKRMRERNSHLANLVRKRELQEHKRQKLISAKKEDSSIRTEIDALSQPIEVEQPITPSVISTPQRMESSPQQPLTSGGTNAALSQKFKFSPTNTILPNISFPSPETDTSSQKMMPQRTASSLSQQSSTSPQKAPILDEKKSAFFLQPSRSTAMGEQKIPNEMYTSPTPILGY